jgi:hypothetical protein
MSKIPNNSGERTTYRSARSPKRFRVLTAGLAKPAAGYHVLTGLAKPSRRAYWRYVITLGTYARAAEYAATLDRELGFAILAPDGNEVDFVDAAGKVLA